MEKIIVQKLHEIEEKEHGKILLAGQWILESEIAGLREKAGTSPHPCIDCKKTNYAGVFMKDYIEERAVEIAYYIIENKATVRQTAVAFGVSKSTIHKDVTERLLQINPSLAGEARKVLDLNKSERHIRGGLATREKYLHQHA